MLLSKKLLNYVAHPQKSSSTKLLSKNKNYFFFLQRNSNNRTHTNVKYNKLSGGNNEDDSTNCAGNTIQIKHKVTTNRKTTLTIPANNIMNDLIPIIEPANNSDDEEEDIFIGTSYKNDDKDDDVEFNDGAHYSNNLLNKKPSEPRKIKFYANT